MPGIYWNNVNSCLNELRYSDSVCVPIVLLSDTTGLRHCGYGKHCLARSGGASTLRNETLVLDDYKIYLTEEQQETVAQRLRVIGFLKQSDGWIDYKKYLIRLLYNPKRSIIREILQE